ncbi:MAG: glycosyltransferase [Candidatus Omnitrophota bacterium]
MKQKKHNILFLGFVPYIGGAEVSTLLLLKYLDRERFAPVYIMPAAGLLSDKVAELGVKFVTMPLEKIKLPLPFGYVKTVWRLKQFIKKNKIDLVVCTVELCNQYALPAARLNGVPVACHTRNLIPEFRSFWRTFLHFPDVLIANSKATAESYRSFIGKRQRVEVVHNGVDLKEYSSLAENPAVRVKYKIAPDEFLVGMAARISPPKRQDVFIKAVHEAGKICPGMRAIIAGDTEINNSGWYLEELKQLADKLGLSDKVIFTGFVDNMKELYSSLDLLVLPSQAEPFGRVLIEAMAMGLPVVATRSGGAPEIVEDGVTGFLVQPDDVNSTKGAIVRIVQDRQRSKERGAAGRKRVEKVFTSEENVKRTQEIYLSLIRDDVSRLRAAMDWLCRAQDATSDGGVSAGYSIRFRKWYPSHRETTGYIIPTFFDFFEYSGEKKYFDRAIRMADWELDVQLENGAIPYGCEIGNKEPFVFDTGQVIFGWVRAYKETGFEKYKKAAERAADWLIGVLDEDGCWRRYDFNGIPHTYSVKVAWALLEVFVITGRDEYKDAAVRNIKWTLSNQSDNGWFGQCAFQKDVFPNTHTIAYTIKGLFESGIILKERKYIEKAQRTADALLGVQKKDGSLSGIFDPDWKGTVWWSCLTGNAQISIVWLKLYQLTWEDKYLSAAEKTLGYLKGLQNIKTKNNGIRGAISGSAPIWGGYDRFNYMNWMTKFFADALLLEEKIKNGKNKI